MKSNIPAFDLTATIQSAVEILWSVGFACGYAYAELEDIQKRIIMKAYDLTRRVEDAESARDPYRLAYLAMNDLRRDHDHWYSLLAHRRLRSNQDRYRKWWYWRDRLPGTARGYLRE